MTAARSKSEASAETLRVRSKKVRRQHRITISADMGPLWDWFKDVPHKAAAREIDFLLRLGVLAAAGVRSGSSQAGQATASQPALSVSPPPAPVFSPRRTEAQLDSVPSAEGSEARVEQVAGWNFASAGFDAAAAAVDRQPYAHWPSARTYIRAEGR